MIPHGIIEKRLLVYFLFSKLLARLVVSIQTTDVKSSGTHRPGMHHRLFHHVVRQVAGSILAATVGYTLFHEVKVFLQINIERRNRPVALRLLRLLFHVQHLVLLIHHNHPRTLQLLDGRLLVAHDAAGTLLQGKIHKFLEREEQQVIGSHHQHIIIDMQLLDGIKQIANSPQARIVGFCTIIHDGHRLGIYLLARPFLKDRCKLMVRDDDVLINLWDAVDVVHHASQYGILSDLQQRFREILCQFPQACSITGRYNNIFHLLN